MEERDRMVGAPMAAASAAVHAFDRLEQLRVQRSNLENRRGSRDGCGGIAKASLTVAFLNAM
jgi:hypothetical protein